MADKLKIKVRCVDGVTRAIVANLGTLDPLTQNYTMQMSETFIQDIISTFQPGHAGIINVVLEKE
jgi:hypothetical protein